MSKALGKIVFRYFCNANFKPRRIRSFKQKQT